MIKDFLWVFLLSSKFDFVQNHGMILSLVRNQQQKSQLFLNVILGFFRKRRFSITTDLLPRSWFAWPWINLKWSSCPDQFIIWDQRNRQCWYEQLHSIVLRLLSIIHANFTFNDIDINFFQQFIIFRAISISPFSAFCAALLSSLAPRRFPPRI